MLPHSSPTTASLAALVLALGTAACSASKPAAPVERHAILGRITGAQAGGVTVTLSGGADRQVATDATGEWAFRDLLPGAYTVTAASAGYAFDPPQRPVTIIDADVTGVEFLSSGGRAVSGVVWVGPSPLEGAVVTPCLGAPVATDPSGHYSVTGLLPGQCTITVALDGYTFAPPAAAVDLTTGDQVQDFQASGSRRVSGVVMLGPDPLVGAAVAACGAAPVSTDAAGAYQVAGLLPGPCTLAAALDGYALVPATTQVDLTAGDQVQDFQASGSRRVSGMVRLGADPLAGAAVTACGAAPVLTDATGAYQVAGRLPGPCTVAAALDGYVMSPASVDLDLAQSDSVQDFNASGGRRVSGVVRLGADPLTGVAVMACGAAPVLTDATGAYQVAGRLPGPCTVTAALDGYVMSPASVDLDLAPSDKVQDFAATIVPPVITISGTVTGASAGEVMLTLQPGGLTTTTDGAGRYTFLDVPNGTFMVVPSRTSWSFRPGRQTLTVNGKAVAGQDFVALAPQALAPPVELAAMPGNGSVTLSWRAPGADSVNVYTSPSLPVPTSGAPLSVAASTQTLTGLTNGVPVYAVVTSVKGGVEGPPSAPACAIPTVSDATGLGVYDPLCLPGLSGRRWWNPMGNSVGGSGAGSVKVVNGAARLEVALDDMEPRRIRGAAAQMVANVAAGTSRVTTLRGTVVVPSAGVLRTGGAEVRAALRLLYQPAASRPAGLFAPRQLKDLLVLEVGLVDRGSGRLEAYREVSHCDDAACGLSTAAGIAFADGPGLAVEPGAARGFAPAAYDTPYVVEVSYDEVAGRFGWSIAGSGLGAGLSGTADPSTWVAATPSYAAAPLNGTGFLKAQIATRTLDPTRLGGGSGRVAALFDDVAVGLGGAPAQPWDDFSGNPPSSGPDRLSPSRWSNPVSGSVTPSGDGVEVVAEATSSTVATGGTQYLYLAQSDHLDSVQVDVEIDPTQKGRVVLLERFANDGTASTVAEGAIGDYQAQLVVDTVQQTVTGMVTNCLNDACTSTSQWFSGPIPGASLTAGTHTLSIKYGGGNPFTLGFDTATQTVGFSPTYLTVRTPMRRLEVTAIAGLPAGTTQSFRVKVRNALARAPEAEALRGSAIKVGVSDGTGSSGRIHVVASPTPSGRNQVAGTSRDGPGPQTIRGVPAGTWYVVAFRDLLGSGVRNHADPVAVTGPFTVPPDKTWSFTMVLASPAAIAPPAPALLSATPGPGSVLLRVTPPTDADGVEAATAYKIYWGTDPAATNGAGSPATFAAYGDGGFAIDGLADGVDHYFRISSVVDTAESAPSAVIGPVKPGAILGGRAISGHVAFPGSPAALMVLARETATGEVRMTWVERPVSPQAYSITGVPDGTWQVVAHLAPKRPGAPALGPRSSGVGPGQSPVARAVTADLVHDLEIAGEGANAGAMSMLLLPQTGGFQENYLRLAVERGTRIPVRVTLRSAVGSPGFWDLGLEGTWFGPPPIFTYYPLRTGDAFDFDVVYDDGTIEKMTGAFDEVLTFPALTLNGAAPYTRLTPLLTWTDPPTPPRAPYHFTPQVLLPDGTTRLSTPLSAGVHSWRVTPPLPLTGASHPAVVVQDASGNQAIREEYWLP